MEGKNEKGKQIEESGKQLEESGKQLEEEIMVTPIGLFAEPNLRDNMEGKSGDSMEKFKQLDEEIRKKERGTVLSLSPMSATMEGKNEKGKQIEESGKQLSILEGDEKSRKAHGFGSDITISILAMLSVKDIRSCRAVDRYFNTLISQPTFAPMHFKNTSTVLCIRTSHNENLVGRTLHIVESFFENFFKIGSSSQVRLERLKLPLRGFLENNGVDMLKIKPVKHHVFCVANSCNGVLCLHNRTGLYPIITCNPLTEEFFKLPEGRSSGFHSFLTVGMGFHDNHFKVLRVWIRNTGKFNFMTVAQVNTVGTSKWRTVAGIDDSIFMLTCPTDLNGFIHFLALYDDVDTLSILKFDIESEDFSSFLAPPSNLLNGGDLNSVQTTIGELRGCLYICRAEIASRNVQGWIMTTYGISSSWTRLFTVNDVLPIGNVAWRLFWPERKYDEGGPIVMYNRTKGLFYLEPGEHGVKKFKISITHTCSKYIEAFPHKPSYISLKESVQAGTVVKYARFELAEDREVFFLSGGNQYDEPGSSSEDEAQILDDDADIIFEDDV